MLVELVVNGIPEATARTGSAIAGNRAAKRRRCDTRGRIPVAKAPIVHSKRTRPATGRATHRSPARRTDSRAGFSQPRGMRGRLLHLRGAERFGLPRRYAQESPRRTAERPSRVHHLPHVIARVRQRSVQCLVHPKRLTAYRDGPGQIIVIQRRQRREQDAPPRFPVGQKLRLGDRARLELLLALAPGFLAVAREKIGEPGTQVAADVPADRGDRIAPVRPGAVSCSSVSWRTAPSASAL